MMERGAIELKEHHGRFLALGLGLTYLGKNKSICTLLTRIYVSLIASVFLFASHDIGCWV